MLTGASEKAALDLSHEEIVGNFVYRGVRSNLPSRGLACSKAWGLDSVAYFGE